MRNQNGVTLMALAVTILVMVLLAGVTIGGSLTALKQIRYEAALTELQEIGRTVNEVCEDYGLAKDVSNNSNYSYSVYFTEKYGSSPALVGDATNKAGVTNLVSIYASLSTNSQYTFYFDANDIKNYLGLEVYNINAVLIDFSTKYVYSVDGIKDPGGEYIYYNLAEMSSGKNVSEKAESVASSTFGVNAIDENSATLQNVGDTKLLKVRLEMVRGASGRNYPIEKAYYSLNGGTSFTEVDYLGDCKYGEDYVEFVIYEPGEYTFMLKDTHGKKVTTAQKYVNE